MKEFRFWVGFVKVVSSRRIVVSIIFFEFFLLFWGGVGE